MDTTDSQDRMMARQLRQTDGLARIATRDRMIDRPENRHEIWNITKVAGTVTLCVSDYPWK